MRELAERHRAIVVNPASQELLSAQDSVPDGLCAVLPPLRIGIAHVKVHLSKHAPETFLHARLVGDSRTCETRSINVSHLPFLPGLDDAMPLVAGAFTLDVTAIRRELS